MRLSLLVLCFATIALAAPCFAAKQIPPPFEGRVERLFDGDTFTVVSAADKERVKVRLYGIDAPDMRQPHYQQALSLLRDQASLQQVKVYPAGYDKECLVAEVILLEKKQRLSEVMVRNGYAWAYRAHCKDPALDQAQELARQEGRGIWAESAPEPPWEWRERQPYAVVKKALQNGESPGNMPFPLGKKDLDFFRFEAR